MGNRVILGVVAIVVGVLVVVLLLGDSASDTRNDRLRAEDPPIYITDSQDRRIRVHDFTHHDPASAGSPYQVPCTSINEPTNFAYFSFGPTYDGMPVTHITRSCLGGSTKHLDRVNEVVFGYGTCDIAPGNTGCSLPIDIHSSPVCQRHLSQFDVAHGKPIRWKAGALTVSFEGGRSVDIYTGRSTVTIFGNDAQQVARALEVVRREPAGQRLTPPREGASTDIGINALPPPVAGALQGEVRCS